MSAAAPSTHGRRNSDEERSRRLERQPNAPTSPAAPLRRLVLQRVPLLVAAVFLVPLAAMSYLGTFMRYVADDYCTASTVIERGLLGAQEFWYLNWTGRFGFIFIIDVLDWLGGWTVPLTTLVLLVAWLGVTSVVARHFFSGKSPWHWATALAAVLVCATLGATPNLWQSLYWQTGAVTYALPLVFLTGFVAIVLHLRSRTATPSRAVLWQLAAALMIAASVGSSETSMGMVDAALAIATAIAFLVYRGRSRRAVLTTLLIGLIAAALASVAVVLAPGNSLRGTIFRPFAVGEDTLNTALYPILSVADVLTRAPAYLLFAYALGFVAGHASDISAPSSRGRAWLLILTAGYLVMAASGAPAFYAAGGMPPDRARIATVFTLMVTIVTCGYLSGLRKERRVWLATTTLKRVALIALGTSAVALSLGAGPAMTTVEQLAQTDDFHAYASELDHVAVLARAASASGEPVVRVETLRTPNVVGRAQPGSDPSSGLNVCVARYFGVPAITAGAPHP